MGNTFLDLETTGLDPQRHCIWEIGLITDSGVEYEWILELTNEELAAAEPMALSIGRYYERATQAREWYDNEFYNKFPPNVDIDPKEGWQILKYVRVDHRASLADFIVREIDTAHIIGAVPSFDERRLRDFCQAHSRVLACHYHLVDVEALSAGKLGIQPPWNSKELYTQLGVNPKHFDEHTALGDARMAKAIYEKVFDLTPTYPAAIIQEEEAVNAQ